MEIILNKTIEKVGKAGEVIKVKNGFARNYLLPQKLALVANRQNMALVDKIKAKRVAEEEKDRAEKTEIAQNLEKVPCKIEVLIGEEDKMFGSVTSQDIAKVFKEAGHKVEKRFIHLKEPIKTLGEHIVEIKLASDVVANIKVEVIAKKSS